MSRRRCSRRRTPSACTRSSPSCASEGVGIVYISHRLEEVLSIADRVTVMKDGEVVGTKAAAELTIDEAIRMMVGRPMSAMFPEKRPRKIGEERLVVRDLRAGRRGARRQLLGARRRDRWARRPRRRGPHRSRPPDFRGGRGWRAATIIVNGRGNQGALAERGCRSRRLPGAGGSKVARRRARRADSRQRDDGAPRRQW